MSSKTITDLDDASLQHLLSLLPLTALKNCRGVCKRWQAQIAPHIHALEIPGNDATQLVNSGPWYRRLPAIKHLKLTSLLPTGPFLESLHNAPWQLEVLSIVEGYLTISSAKALARAGSPWRSLRVLHLKQLEVTPEDLKTLAAGSWDCLEELDLSWCEALTEDGGKALAKLLARCLALKKLVLFHAEAEEWIDPEFGYAVFSEILKVKLPLLEEFEGNCNNLDASVMRALAGKESSWPSLKILTVWCNNSVNTHFRNLTKAKFPSLECFTFGNISEVAEIDVENMRALRDALDMRWYKLKRLEISWVEVPAQVAFLEGNLPLLEEISFDDKHLDTDVLRALAVSARNGRLKLLKTLCLPVELDYCFNDDDGGLQYIGEILRSGSWPNLQNLEVSIKSGFDGDNVPVLVSALAQAAQAKFFPALRSFKLVIDDTPSSDIETIFQHPWPALETLKLECSPYLELNTAAFVEAAVANLPKLKTLTVDGNLSVPSANIILEANWPALKEFRVQRVMYYPKDPACNRELSLQGWEASKKK